MKLTNQFRKSSPPSSSTASAKKKSYRPAIFLGIFILLSALIFLVVPQPEKRFYAILGLVLLWLLDIIFFDDETSRDPTAPTDSNTKSKIRALQSRLQDAVKFIKIYKLNQTPWFLLIGPEQSGKSAFIVNSEANFVLHPHMHANQAKKLEPSTNCSWWITRDICLVDVPGSYLTAPRSSKQSDKPSLKASPLWVYLLKAIRKLRGKKAISGVIVALPLAEIIQQNDSRYYQHITNLMSQRLRELKSMFSHKMPVYLVLTKCDLIPGFYEFFSKSSSHETAQLWGVDLPLPKKDEKVAGLFAPQFNELLKKLNQQLLWRLHQEYNPMLRPAIKDFPLQMELMKKFLVDFIAKFHVSLASLPLQGVYMTSALQLIPEPEQPTHSDINTTHRELQLVREAPVGSRPYFIRQLLTQGFTYNQLFTEQSETTHNWKVRTAYAVSVSSILVFGALLGKDFISSVQHTRTVQMQLAEYQRTFYGTHDPDEYLEKSLSLLMTLQQAANKEQSKMNFAYLLKFYTHQTEQKSVEAYRHALQVLLLPQIKNFLEDYLKNPVNKDDHTLYATLAAYLMLSDPSRLEPVFFSQTLKRILPKSIHEKTSANLLTQVNGVIGMKLLPTSVDATLIQETRNYLTAKPGSDLGYIILKNMNNNIADSHINLTAILGNTPLLSDQAVITQIPRMFTADSFPNVVSQEMITAAQDASTGNWVLGYNIMARPEMTINLLNELRTRYVTNYAETWERLLANIQLTTPKSLAETDEIVVQLSAAQSPLWQLLKTVHDNTYFEPLASASPKLQNLGLLVDKNNTSAYSFTQIAASLNAMHVYLQGILTAPDEKKAAYEALASRLQRTDYIDPITQVRLLATRSPEPVKIWLEKITDDAWRYLVMDASYYLNTAWQNQVVHFYETEIASRFPFNPGSAQTIDPANFTAFFGHAGIVNNFYSSYLNPLVDTSKIQWQWKTLNQQPLPLSPYALQQIQFTMHFEKLLFPNGHSAKSLQTGPLRLAKLDLWNFHFPKQLFEQGNTV